jgi:hypothetical protein
MSTGVIPDDHRLELKDPDKAVPAAWNPAVLEACLRTQTYDKGFDRFIRKFKPDAELNAVMAIEEGKHGEWGTAILFTQENLRCLLMETVHKLRTQGNCTIHPSVRTFSRHIGKS